MREIIFAFIHQYAVWGILAFAIIATLLLWRMHTQMKRLNCNLKKITEGIGNYLNVILAGEEEEREEKYDGIKYEDRFLTKEERDILLAPNKKKHTEEEEAVFQAVMQEYFS